MERTLVICEKPSAALRIARALDESRAPESFNERGVDYHVARRGDEDLIIVSALGHLFSITQDEGTWTYPVFDLRWVPAYEANKRMGRTRRFIDVIKKLSMGVGGYVSACDYDMEGSLIAYMILLHVCGEESLERAMRMRFSTLTEQDLVRAWDGRSPTLDFPLIHAGRARHEVDWLFGINLTRALTLSVKNATGYYKTLSIGRVQGPTLNFIKEREVEIRTFVPTPYWAIKAGTKIGRKKYSLEYVESRLESGVEAERIVNECKGKDGIIASIDTRKQEQWPFPPFNLGDLQREAYYKLRYSPRTTLQAAERLYLRALISYPRTSSQRLPPSIDLRRILEGLRKREEYSELAQSLLDRGTLRPRQGKKDDPAHPAIHPTGKLPGKLSRVDGRIYDLICRRFMAALGDPAVKENIVVEVDVEGHIFYLRGSQLLERGWTRFYAPFFRVKGVVLPTLKIGLRIPIIEVNAERKHTKPASRYNPGSLIKLMEDEGVGTKATRTEVVDTLFRRGYAKGGNIEITDLGLAIVETLERLVPEILSVEMTRGLERDLELIQTGESDASDVVRKAVGILEPILAEFKANENLIGVEINEALKAEAMRENTLGPCPGCGTGEIRILKNRQTGKRFAGCSNFFNDTCSVSYPLPQKGRIQATGKICLSCGAPMIKVLQRRRRPWRLCINFDCPSKRKEDQGDG
ncbi:MAG: DNA topoisomerase I [Candidatus Bathyarchaeota archaeon]|nr:MAG: DNA topoisomerase I [Candidatus Bathyarchaeota archaeon]